MSSPPRDFLKRAQMRRVSLPTALPPPHPQNGGGRRSPRSRTPNSLSPKLGFLKEISEFDANLDPPFISPAASSSSSADNSHCNSPMLLSPCNQRPASARLYRRNRGGQQQTGSTAAGTKESPVGQRKPISTRSMICRHSEPFAQGEPDDGFRWTDVDGFYGRKNSIPLQQLLANDLALLNGIGLKSAAPNGDKQAPLLNGSPPAHHLLDVDQGGAINIPSDITEDEDEDRADAERKKRDNGGDGGGGGGGKSVLNDVKKSDSSAPKSSPTKRRLMMLSNRLYSLEEAKRKEEKEEEEDEEEEGNGEEEAKGKESEEAKKTETMHKLLNGGKVKFMDSVDELELNKNDANGPNDDEVRQLRRAVKARKRRDAKMATQQQLRHFSVDQHGRIVLDSGVKTFRAKLHPDRRQASAAPPPRNPKARRATCPEIWLSVAEDDHRPLAQCAVRLFGCQSVGKKCIAKQIASSAEVSPVEEDIVSIESEDLQRPYRTVSFLLNEHEVNMEIIQGSLLPESRQGAASAVSELTIFAVVYSVDNRESFIRAAQILYRLYGNRRDQQRGFSSRQRAAMERACVPLILIANKSDLQRRRRVSSIEGKMLAKIYKCPFVEMSALLSANVDTLWREILRKLHKYLQMRQLLQQKQDSVGSSDSGSSPRLLGRQPLVGRIVERTRRFAKSCEDWIAARIVAI